MTKDIFLHEISRLTSTTVTFDNKLRDDLSISSLKMMMIIVRIEELSGKDFPMEKIAEAKTVEDLWYLLTDD